MSSFTTTYVVIYYTGRGRWSRCYTRLGDAKRFIRNLQLPREGRKKKPFPPVDPENIFLFVLDEGTPALDHEVTRDELEGKEHKRRQRGDSVAFANVGGAKGLADMLLMRVEPGQRVPNSQEWKAYHRDMEFFTVADIQKALTWIRETRDPRVTFVQADHQRSPLIRRRSE